MAFVFAPPESAATGEIVSDDPDVVTGPLSDREEGWYFANQAPFMREVEPYWLRDDGYLAVREGSEVLDTALAGIITYAVKNDVLGDRFHVGELESNDGLVVDVPTYTRNEFGIERVAFRVNEHEVLLVESGWWIRPSAPGEEQVDVITEAFWEQLKRVVNFTGSQTLDDISSEQSERVLVAA